MFRTLLLLISITTLVSPECCDCPDRCICKWITGKNTVICISSGFTEVPKLSPDTQVLNLNNNYMTHLKGNAFGSIGLVNLQKIFMKNVTLREIHKDAFKDMTILVEINMSDNFITSIPRSTFAGNVRLKILVLSGNPLKTLGSQQFPLLPCLRTLELDSCQLRNVHEEAFSNLNELEILNLKLNDLQSISRETFSNLTNLKSLSLEGNPWRCDCQLRDFRNWYLSSSLPSMSPICYEPEVFKQRLWTSIMSEDFTCLPEVSITNGDVEYKELGESMTLNCVIKGKPEPRVSWLFNGVPISIGTNETFTEDISVEKLDDGFVEKSSNLSIEELNEFNFGRYVCLAKSSVYLVEAKILIAYPIPIPPSAPRGHGFWFLFTGLSILSLILFILTTSAVACGCMTYNRNKRKNHLNMNKITEPEKHLLESTNSRKNSCEKLDDIGRMATLRHSSSIDRYNSNMQLRNTGMSNQYINAFPACPPIPPPEQFLTRSRTLGNVYQSTSRDPQYRSRPNIDSADTLDVVPKPKRSKAKSSSSFLDVTVLPFATLPRKQFINENASLMAPKYDNVGKRVSVRGSTLSFHDIPPPPPPPLSSKLDFEFIPL